MIGFGPVLVVAQFILETSLQLRIYFGRALPNWGVVVSHPSTCKGAATLVTQQSLANNGGVCHKIDEFIWGRKDFVTDCPYGEKGRYTNAVNKVGDLGCNTCEWQVRHNQRAQVVMCSHSKEEKSEVKKLFNDL